MSTAVPAEPGPPAETPAPTPRSRVGKGKVQCVVVTPERTLLDRSVDFVALPLFDGELGILPGRTPLIGRLGSGPLRVRTGTTSEVFFIDGGFAQVRDDVVTVLTSRSVPAIEIDLAAARTELDQARSRVATGDAELDEKNRAVMRARAKVRIASN